jgi:hypothetical protein
MRKLRLAIILAAGAATLGAASYAIAGPDDGGQFTRMESYFEVPAISSTGQGEFRAKIDENDAMIHYTLTWENLEVSATQAHIHLGQRSVNGGISVFLCTNLGNAPPSPPAPPTQACPVGPSGTVTGTITPAHVIGPTNQGIEPGSFAELVAAMKEGFTYANIHSARYPGGEIRGQIGANHSDNTGERAHDAGQ